MKLITALTITPPTATPVVFDGSNFILTEASGFEMPTVRLPRYNLPGASGGFISNALYGERAITLKGYVNAPNGSRVTYLNNRLALINALVFSPTLAGTPQPQTLTLTLENGLTLSTTVYTDTPLQMGFSPEQPDYEAFQISFVAPDPNLYSTTSVSATIALPSGGGTAIPTAIPISLAPSVGGSATMTNPGSISSAPTITLSAPLGNPYIINQTTNQYLSLNYTLNPGDASLVINCAAQTITQGTNNVTGIQTVGSTFWSLLPGINTIGFSAASGSGQATVVFSPGYLGF